ncbi:hypothetical protein PHJA_002493700 [Phtheirospermum japonicum]|uniref:Uncharacterized protein n=1 Tax=Phtheirospermum japonicum TaxID=374723 RepID=A0A830D0Z1_9LAMI|nr:hypothetical protein PHJA_002493700 [Phtheirospermum japonicum]
MPPPSGGGTNGRKRCAVASNVQKILSKISCFQFPPHRNPNHLRDAVDLHHKQVLLCYHPHNLLASRPFHTLLLLFPLHGLFSGARRKFYYEFMMPKGLIISKTGLGMNVPQDEKY